VPIKKTKRPREDEDHVQDSLRRPDCREHADRADRRQCGAAGSRAGQDVNTTKTVKLAKKHKHHVVKHHARAKFAKHVRHHNKFVSHKRHGKFVKAHVRHGKIVKVGKTQKHATPKIHTSAK